MILTFHVLPLARGQGLCDIVDSPCPLAKEAHEISKLLNLP